MTKKKKRRESKHSREIFFCLVFFVVPPNCFGVNLKVLFFFPKTNNTSNEKSNLAAASIF